MKVAFSMSDKCIVALLCLFGLFAGCTTPRHAPSPLPRFVTDYREQSVYDQLKRLTVKLELREFGKLDSCIMTTGSAMGGTAFEVLPFKSVVQREFQEAISKNFLRAGERGVKAKVVLEVVPRVYEIERNTSNDVRCNMDFSIKLYAPRTDFPPKELIYRKVTVYHDIEGLIPCSLYAAIQNVVKDFITDLPEDPDLMASLRDLLVGHGDINYEDPIPNTVGQDIYYNEAAHVKCNDDERDIVEKWAKEQITRVRGERYFKNIEYCVFFSPSKFDDETRRLDLIYDIIARKDFIMIPSSANGRSGRCFVDCVSFKTYDSQTLMKIIQSRLLRSAKENGTPAANVEVTNLYRDNDNPEFCRAEYKFK